MPERRTIVMVEDSEEDALLIRRRLNEHLDEPFDLKHFTRMADAQQFLAEHRKDTHLILLDLGLPDTRGGVDTFQRMKEHSLAIPVVILTSVDDHNLAVGLVREGAENFVNKGLLHDKPELLRDAVDFAISRHKIMDDINKKAIEELAQKDMVISWMSGGYSMQK